jgi:hypothetical protein
MPDQEDTHNEHPDFARGQETEEHGKHEEPRPDFARGERESEEVTTESEAGDFAEGQGEAHPKDVPQGDFARGQDREDGREDENIPGE